jgi:hypothetical protein
MVSAGLLTTLFTSTSGHSWPEALNLINSQGTMYGATGYVRNFVPRNATGFRGDENDSFQKTQSVPGAKVCMSRETTQTQSPGYPRLAVTPGAKVALRYAENGHVTIEQPGRPAAGGPVYIFGTNEGTGNPLITDVMQWNAQGAGGNKGGKLLTTQNFDDGRCYENNPSAKASQRKAAAPLGSDTALPYFSGLPCQNDFMVPTDAKIGQPYTIYWVWNFTFPAQFGGTEVFSNCLDLDVQAPQGSNKAADVGQQNYNAKQPAVSAAVQSYFVEMASAPASQPVQSSAPPQPSSSSTFPAAQSPKTSPAAQSNPTSGLVAEGSGGHVYGPQATNTAPVQTPTTTPAVSPSVAASTPSIDTVYITIMPSGLNLPSISLPGVSPSSPAGSASAEQQSTPGQSQIAPTTLQPTVRPSTPQQSPQQSSQQSPQQSPQHSPQQSPQQSSQQSPQQTPAAHAAQASPESANGLSIPLLTVGASGVSRVSPTPAAAPAAGSTPKQDDAESDSSSSSPMPTGEDCKKKRRAYRRSKFSPPK